MIYLLKFQFVLLNFRKPPSFVNEPEIDLEKLPVIQGSFEITKTDADISVKKKSDDRTLIKAYKDQRLSYTEKPSTINITETMSRNITSTITTTAGNISYFNLFFF